MQQPRSRHARTREGLARSRPAGGGVGVGTGCGRCAARHARCRARASHRRCWRDRKDQWPRTFDNRDSMAADALAMAVFMGDLLQVKRLNGDATLRLRAGHCQGDASAWRRARHMPRQPHLDGLAGRHAPCPVDALRTHAAGQAAADLSRSRLPPATPACAARARATACARGTPRRPAAARRCRPRRRCTGAAAPPPPGRTRCRLP